VSESNEDANEFETPAEVLTPAEETAPEAMPNTEAVHEAVHRALAKQAPNVVQRNLEPCPCGTDNVNLLIDVAQGSKVGRATCGACGIWGVDFLAPRSQDKELMGRAATKVWNEAPR